MRRLDGILRRNIHHAFQNGAERVYVTDLEAAGTAERPVMYMAGMCLESRLNARKTGLERRSAKN